MMLVVSQLRIEVFQPFESKLRQRRVSHGRRMNSIPEQKRVGIARLHRQVLVRDIRKTKQRRFRHDIADRAEQAE